MSERKKLASLVRVLGSDKDGEIVAAARAIGRVLESQGRDFNDLGEVIEHGGGNGSGPLNQVEMEQIYDVAYKAGYAKGADDAGSNRIFNLNGFYPANGSVSGPTWIEMAQFVEAKASYLHRDRDRDFAESIAEQATYKSRISPAQENWLRDLYVKLGGKITP